MYHRSQKSVPLRRDKAEAPGGSGRPASLAVHVPARVLPEEARGSRPGEELGDACGILGKIFLLFG